MGALPELKAQFRKLTFGRRMTIGVNWYAFFFGFIYYAVFLRLWRQALVLIALQFAVGFSAASLLPLLPLLPNGAVSGAIGGTIGAYMVVGGARANPLYYLSRTGRDIGWSL